MDTHQHPVSSGRDRQVPTRVPDWTNWNEHDPGVTIVALFGFVATGLLWHLSGRQHGSGSKLYRVIGVGLSAASVALLLRQRRRRRRPSDPESAS